MFILHLYDRAILNGAALRAVGYTKDTPNPPGGEIMRDKAGNPTGLLLAKPNATILYATLAKGPKLPPEYQKNSTRHFMREVNRLGVTGVIDAGGGYQNYPDDYNIIEELHKEGQLTVRLAYNLFTQKPKEELSDFKTWTSTVKPGQGDDLYRHNGAGEMLVYTAADFEDFRVERPDMPPSMEGDLEPVIRLLAEKRWPWRLHATYDETITRALDVYEKVAKRHPVRRPELVLRPRRDHHRPQYRPHRGAGRRHRRAAPHGLPGRVFRRALRRQGGRGHAADQADAGEGRDGGRRHRCHARGVLQPVGVAVLADHGQDRGRHGDVSAGQPARPRNRAAPLDRGQHVVLDRKWARRARSRWASWPTSPCSSRDYFGVPGDEIQDISVGADPAGRQGGLRRQRVRQARARSCRRPCRTGRRPALSAASTSGARRPKASRYALRPRLRLRQLLRRARPRARRRRGRRACRPLTRSSFWGALGLLLLGVLMPLFVNC